MVDFELRRLRCLDFKIVENVNFINVHLDFPPLPLLASNPVAERS